MWIHLENSDAANNFVSSKERWSSRAFSVSKWDGNYRQKERIAWLYIKGVSAHLWNSDTFDLTTNSFGSVI